MKFRSFIKRYRVFLILVAVNIIVGIISPDTGIKSLLISKDNLLEMLSLIPPVFVLLGLLDVWVDRATMIKFTGKGSGFKGLIISFLLGSCAAGPLYAAFPIAAVMLKKGSSIFNVMIFIGAWSTTKIPMLTFEAASMGLKFMLIRLALSICGIIIIALIIDKSLKAEERAKVYEMNT